MRVTAGGGGSGGVRVGARNVGTERARPQRIAFETILNARRVFRPFRPFRIRLVLDPGPAPGSDPGFRIRPLQGRERDTGVRVGSRGVRDERVGWGPERS
jgi:hypothetical protein